MSDYVCLAEVEDTVPMSFFIAGTDIKPSTTRRPPYNRLQLFTELENHERRLGTASIWNGSSRMHLETLDSCLPDASAPDSDLVRGGSFDCFSNLEDIDDFVPASVEDAMSAANTPPRFSSPSLHDHANKKKESDAVDLF